MSISTLPAHCTVTSWQVHGDEPAANTRTDYGTFTWQDFRNLMTVASAVQVTTDLWDAAQPDGTIRRYRAVQVQP